MTLALVGELVRLGSRAASTADELTRSQIIAESVMAEVVTGIVPAEAVNGAPVENDPDWVYSVSFERAEQPSMVTVNVTVEKAETDEIHPLVFTLTRWMLDPGVELPESEDEANQNSSSSSSSEETTNGS